jgi:hypothetical protein
MKGLYWATGALIAAQLIYCYNSSLGWLYAVFYLTNLILTDLFTFDFRKHEVETAVLFNYMVIAGGIITGMISSPLVLTVFLIPAGFYNVWLSFRGYKVFRSPQEWVHVSARNKKIAQKQSVFMKLFFGLIGLISIAGLIMGLFQ